MTKRIASFYLALALLFAICPRGMAVDVESVTLFGVSRLLSGDSSKITAVVNPQNASERDLTWTSSNSSVAQVNSYGVVTAGDVVEDTSVTITAAAGGVSGEHVITVYPRALSVEITPSRVEIDLSDGFVQFEAVVYPRTAAQDIAWSVSNKRVAAITSDGLMSAKRKGVVTVRAKALGQESIMATARVEISKVVTGITIKGATRLRSGKKTKLNAVIVPKIKKKDTLIWECLTPDIAKVSKSGRVTALDVDHEQTAVIRVTARANPLASATHEITIFPAAE